MHTEVSAHSFLCDLLYHSVSQTKTKPLFFQITVECHYNAVQYNMIIAYNTAVTDVECKVKFESTKDDPFLALTGELWGVFS